MNKLKTCRRTFITLVGIITLTIICLTKDIDTTNAIASIIIGLSAANAAEGSLKKKEET